MSIDEQLEDIKASLKILLCFAGAIFTLGIIILSKI